MARSRAKKATVNIATNLLYEVITFICGLILPRLILSHFGSTYNGIISSVTQFLSLVSILRLGVAGATRVALYRTLATNDLAGTSAIVRATEKYLRKVGLAILVYIAVLAVVYPMFTDTGIGFFDVSVLVIATGIGTFAQYYFGITNQTFLSADQSTYISNIAQICSTLANTVLSAVLIYSGCTIQTVKLASSVVFFLTPFMLNIYVARKYSLDKKCEPDYTGLEKRNDLLASSLANIVHENTDVIVLTLSCDVKTVSVYAVYNLVMSALRKILAVFSTGTEAIYGDMWAKHQMDSIKKNLTIYEYVIGVFISIVFSATIMLIVPFVRIYTKGVTDVNYIQPTYALVISVAMVFFCFRIPYLTLVQGIGAYKETKAGAFFEAGLNLTSSIVLVKFIGITGTAIGTLLANVFRSFQYAFYIERNVVSRGKVVLLKDIIWISINLGLSCSIARILFFRIDISSWSGWCCCGVMVVFISITVTLMTSLIAYRPVVMQTYAVIRRMIGVPRRRA